MQTRRRELGGTHVACVCLVIGAAGVQRYSFADSIGVRRWRRNPAGVSLQG
jgi:hypothetical protein